MTAILFYLCGGSSGYVCSDGGAVPHWREREEAIGDFGGLFERRPLDVVRAHTEEDVVEAVRRARRLGVPIAPRGQGHTTRGQTLVEGGILITLAGLDRVRIEGDTAVVGAGARWDDVVRATWAHGMTPPTLTDYLGLSVGGTLSVGGVGGQAFRYGTQTDQVEELRVVTGRGEPKTCSADKDHELFYACLGGLGQVAVIVEARLRLIPAPTNVRVHRVTYGALGDLLEDMWQLTKLAIHGELRGSALPDGDRWMFVLEVVEYLGRFEDGGVLHRLCGHRAATVGEVSYLKHVDRLRALETDMRLTGMWSAHHPWIDLFVPMTRARKVIGGVLDDLRPADMASGHIMFYPLHAPTCRTPLLRVPGDPYAVLFDLLPDVPRGELSALERWEALAERTFARARQEGARMYPIGFPVGTRQASWPEHFEDAWPAFAAARATNDPDGLLTPGAGIFMLSPNAQPGPTLGELATERLARVGRALGCVAQARELAEIVAITSGSWFSEPVGQGPRWGSDVTDDGTPFEISVGLSSGTPDLRLLLEPRPIAGDALESYRAAARIAETLRDRYGAELGSLTAISDLFEPTADSRPRFTLWYAFQTGARGLLCKVYVNPEVRGVSGASELVRLALNRLGRSDAWSYVEARLDPATTIPYFSIDLCSGERARVKVYLAHHGSSSDSIERAAAGGRNHRAGDVVRWLSALAASEGSWSKRPVLTCHAFSQGNAPEMTLHVPIRCYVATDAEALRRARTLCERTSGEVLARVVEAIRTRPLDTGRGLITYVSLRRTSEHVRVTGYFAPELYAVTAPHREARFQIRDLRRTIEAEQARYASHRFFRRIEGAGTRAEAERIAHGLSFFIMAFQDLLRLARERCQDPELSEVLRSHELEDAGHDVWFLDDLQRLGMSPELSYVFEREHAAIRDVSYTILAHVLRAQHDVTLLAILLSLEAAGHEFFERFGRFIARALEKSGDHALVFFGAPHLAAESSHRTDLGAETAVFDRGFGDAEMAEILIAVRTVFAQMTRVADHMACAFEGAPVAPPTGGAQSHGAQGECSGA